MAVSDMLNSNSRNRNRASTSRIDGVDFAGNGGGVKLSMGYLLPSREGSRKGNGP